VGGDLVVLHQNILVLVGDIVEQRRQGAPVGSVALYRWLVEGVYLHLLRSGVHLSQVDFQFLLGGSDLRVRMLHLKMLLVVCFTPHIFRLDQTSVLTHLTNWSEGEPLKSVNRLARVQIKQIFSFSHSHAIDLR